MATITFDTTHHALWAEEIARENGVPVEVVPAPAEARARCNLALETLPNELDRLVELLDDSAVPHRLHLPAAGDGRPAPSGQDGEPIA